MRNRTFYRTIAGAAAGMLLSLAAAVTAWAATGKLSFSDPSVETGTEVNVTMKIAADEDATLSDATVTLRYPSEQLEFVSGTDADGGAGTVRVHGASIGQGTSVLEYNLKFKTLSAGDFQITVDTQEVYDGSGQPVEMTHLGTSSVKVTAPAALSQNADLAGLEVSPGTLEPAFSADVTSYSVTCGTATKQLAVNAPAADSGAKVAISGNEALTDGGTVTVSVTAADGQTAKNYDITVHLVEGGPEEAVTENGGSELPTTEGVQLSSKGKTITIMNPTSDVQIPDGLKAGTISIDGQKVQGWVWGADTDPKYCVVYGMNDQGELNFYRYDMAEKTIQRYFEDPLAADSVSNRTYAELAEQMESVKRASEIRFFIIAILALICFVLLAIVIYLSSKLRGAGREQTRRSAERRRAQLERRYAETRETEEADETLLQHDFDPEQGFDFGEDSGLDETQVIHRPERRKRQRRDMDETMAIPHLHVTDAQESGTSEAAEAAALSGDTAELFTRAEVAEIETQTAPSDAQEGAENDSADDAFETFDL